MLPTLEIRVLKAQYWAFSVIQEFYQNHNTWSGANRCAPKPRKQTGLLNFERGKRRFFTLRVMIILSVFKPLKVNCSFDNLCQKKAFSGCWGGLVVQSCCVRGWMRRSSAAPARCADPCDCMPFTGIKLVVLQSQTFRKK